FQAWRILAQRATSLTLSTSCRRLILLSGATAGAAVVFAHAQGSIVRASLTTRSGISSVCLAESVKKVKQVPTSSFTKDKSIDGWIQYSLKIFKILGGALAAASCVQLALMLLLEPEHRLRRAAQSVTSAALRTVQIISSLSVRAAVALASKEGAALITAFLLGAALYAGAQRLAQDYQRRRRRQQLTAAVESAATSASAAVSSKVDAQSMTASLNELGGAILGRLGAIVSGGAGSK
uniref:CAP-Gly domain-containing protein n=2 Tax=Macrostomum lignano TaxID=282301 RepID=A0A1I8HW53_9PLAT